MKDNLKQLIIKYLEAEGESSKSRIEDYMKDLKGTTGDCVSRRLRELVAQGTVEKFKKEYADKTYFAYRVKPLEIVPNPKWITYCEPTKELKLNI